jgi:hypothetical protein
MRTGNNYSGARFAFRAPRARATHMAQRLSARTFCGRVIADVRCARPGDEITCKRCQRGYGDTARSL